MHNQQRQIRRRIIKYVVVFTIFPALLLVSQNVAWLQNVKEPGKDETQQSETTNAPIRAEKRGFPHVNFKDGKDLFAAQAEVGRNSQLKLLASADFNSDGIADLVTAETNGTVKLYRGNHNSLSSETKQDHRQNNEETFPDAPFRPAEKSFALNIAPDYLETGDFNADGKPDVLAAANGDHRLQFLAGDGQANFGSASAVAVDGQISAMSVGEIGKPDGQADLAVAVNNDKGAFLLVFEHPESAFKHAPEVFKLNSPASVLAIGNLDDDFYADIAVASGNQLTIIHGRGQVYPWDLDERFKIERPKAVVAKRQMPFPIAGLEIGNFTDARGDDLAILANSGGVFILEPAREGKVSNIKLPEEAKRQTGEVSFAPTGTNVRKYGVIDNSQNRRRADKESGLMLIDSRLSPKERQEFSTKKVEEEAKRLEKLSEEELAKQTDEAKAKGEENRQRSKEAFIRTISGKPSTLAAWKLTNPVIDPRLANAANSPAFHKIIKARVSDSGKDDLILLDSISNQIQIVTETRNEDQRAKTEVVSLDAESSPVSVLNMRLNADALDDLVILREDSSQPSFLMTAPAATFTVNTTSDEASNCQTAGQPCTLRQAIQLANANPGADTIAFNILGCGPHKIQPLSELPVITQPVTIQGSSQPCYSGSPRVEINGELITGQPADGLKIRASSSVIQGLSITGFPFVIDDKTGSKLGGNGITVETPVGFARSTLNIIYFNYLGVAPDGTTDKGNSSTGVLVFDGDSSYIYGNTISGNSGTGIDITAGNNNTIAANKIGTNAAGTAKLPNDAGGIFLTGNDNKVGGDNAGDGNTISGNGKPFVTTYGVTLCRGNGISVYPLISEETGELLTNGNTLKGNRIGTNQAGTAPLGNCTTGVFTDPITTTTIGSITDNGRNVISDNGHDAIHCGWFDYHPPVEGGYCSIVGNNVGTDITGTIAISNDWRNVPGGLVEPASTVNVFNNLTLSNIGAPGGTTPGGACTGFCNLVSGNDLYSPTFGAVGRWGFGVVKISNNFVGTNKNGTAALPNNNDGIYATDSDTFVGGYNTEQNVNFGNLASGNKWAGIVVYWWAAFFDANFNIESNLVGTDTTGGAAIPNATDNGLSVPSAINAISVQNWKINIGGVNPFSKNYISGNSGSGIIASALGGKTNVINNYIGVSKFNQPLGNTRHGIVVGGDGTTVGGTGAGEGNVIASNAFAGVAVLPVVQGNVSNTFNNPIRGNTIRNNGGLGIDLTVSATGDGVTPNDCDDSDDGANRRQNFPILFAPTFNQDGTVKVSGVIRSLPFKKYKIDFYSNAMPDPTEHGEGEAYLGVKEVEANGNGVAYFEFVSAAPVANTHKITATATDPEGNTSEFSCFAGGCETGSLQNVAEAENFSALLLDCTVPIVVNITTDEPDADGNQREEARDGKCDVFTDAEHPGDQCSLRAAIQEANARSSFNLINFNIPGEGVKTISPASALPDITGRVFINGATQPGNSDLPLIELNGINTPEGTHGLKFLSGSGGTVGVFGSGSTVLGLAIYNWRGGSGVYLEDSNSSQVLRSHLGVKADGTPVESRNQIGVFAVNSSYVRVGYSDSDGNLISGNDSGAVLSNCLNCRIESNKIGTNKTGTTAVPNIVGIKLSGGTTGARIFKNVISGNKSDGVSIQESSTDNVLNNNIFENLIGTTSDGMSILKNEGSGIFISDSNNNRINSNTISGNAVSAIEIAADLNQVDNNKIGVSADGLIALPNKYGIFILNSSKNKIGAAGANIISGNTERGIVIDGTDGASESNEIQNNLIGLNANNQDLGNGKEGVFLEGDVSQTLIKGNTISGNGLSGILSGLKSNHNTISENKIGAFAANKIGITITQSSHNKILGNEITGNEDFNLLLGNSVPVFSGAGNQNTPSSGNLYVEENEVFDNTIKNSKVGLAITEKARNNYIGKSGHPNKIIENRNASGYGIFLGTTTPEPNEDLLPSGNRIFNNEIGAYNASAQITFPNKVGLVILQAKDNFIGNEESTGNTFQANEKEAIILSGNKTKGNLIFHNIIGALAGSVFGNGSDGIFVTGTGTNTIKYNSIGNNGGNGINAADLILQQGEENSLIISANKIGADYSPINLHSRFKNEKAGIRLSNVQNARIGVEGEDKNIIANNGGDGILIEGENSKFNLIVNSIIGALERFDGYFIGNLGNGIYINGGRENTIGGAKSVNHLISGAGNFISGNNQNGILIENSRENNIYGNGIGIFTTAEGNIIRGNNQNGIKILNSHNTNIGAAGGQLNFYENIIGGNKLSGIVLQGNLTQFNRVKGNYIGVDWLGTFLGNGLHGVFITEQGQKNIVGGKEIEAGNVIAYNGSQLMGGAGVYIDSTAGSGNNADPNLIYGNFGLGVDLGAPGHTPNDPADADTGPNNLQNYPDIVSKQIVNNELIVNFKVDSAPANSNYGTDGLSVEFFKADASGEGEKFLGSTHYTAANYNSGSPQAKQVNLGSITALGITVNDKITSAVTDADGNTSEFSPVAADVYSVSGVVSYGNIPTGASAKFVSGVMLAATGATPASITSGSTGAYLFDNLTSGTNHTVTPSKTGEINSITAFDATLILRHIAAGANGTNALNPKQRIAADTDNSGDISAFDATLILRTVATNAQTVNTGQVGNWKFVPDKRDYLPLQSTMTDQNFEAYLRGDVDGSWTTPGNLAERPAVLNPDSLNRFGKIDF